MTSLRTFETTHTPLQVEACVREPKRTLEKKFDIALALCNIMNADPAPVYLWASDLQDEYHFADRPCPEFLNSLAVKSLDVTEGYPCTAEGLQACLAEVAETKAAEAAAEPRLCPHPYVNL